MPPIVQNTAIPNPLHSFFISPQLLADNAEERIHNTTSFEPFALITTKHHPTLPLSIHNYNHRSFWAFSSLSSQVQTIIDSQAVLSDQDEGPLALTLASRTLVTERLTGRVVSRSFAKFFNHEETMAYKPSGDEYAYEIQEKVDGSIISLFWYEPPTSSGGQWVVVSRASFSSPHTESAWNILNTRFPSLVSNTQESLLDKTKTYVFELVDNQLAIKIRYEYDLDLVLLSVIGNDGSETRLSKSGLPFRRPRTWTMKELISGEDGFAATASNLKKLGKLHRANEEGFVFTFWRTEEDVYPQRVKVKLEDYLKSCKISKKEGGGATVLDPSSRTPLRHLSKSGTGTKPLVLDGPPSANALVNIYTAHRMSILSLNGIDAAMSSLKERLLEAIRCLDVLDDYGSEAWLAKIMKTWDRIHGLFAVHEIDWKDTVKRLKEEGYRPRGRDATVLPQDFEKRISSLDKSITPSLRGWFEGQNIREIVKLVVESVEVPDDLMSTDIIIL